MALRPVKQSDRKPSFAWQGVLILAPILVLSAVGVFAAKKDRRAVRNEAEQQAREFAERAAMLVWDALQNPSSAPPGVIDAPRRPGTPMIIGHGLPGFTGAAPAIRIQLDAQNMLADPRPYEPSPAPAWPDSAGLEPAQADLWAALNREVDPVAARSAATEFLKTSPPTNYQAGARLVLGRALMESRDYARAAVEFAAATNLAGAGTSPAGLPLDVVARLNLFEAQRKAGQFRSRDEHEVHSINLLRYAMEHPSALTPELLRRAMANNAAATNPTLIGPADTLKAMSALWEQQEEARQVFRVFRATTEDFPVAPRLVSVSQSGVPAAYDQTAPAQARWVSWTEHREGTNEIHLAATRLWCVLRLPGPAGATLVCRPFHELKQMVDSALAGLRLPQYFAATLAVAWTNMVAASELEVLEMAVGGRGGGQFLRRTVPTELPPVLGTFTHAEGGRPLVTANVHLVAPDLLYARQNQRVVWLGLVVGAAALTAVIGFLSAYRAFRRQLRLADLKSNFVSSVSHELRAPIASVRLMAEGLERGTISDAGKQREYFRFIVQECRRLSSMIENVLDFARIDQGRKQYVLEPANLRAVVEQTIRAIEPYAAERGVLLKVSVDEQSTSDWTAVADGQAMQQALVNLIDNAVKHSRAGEQVLVELAFVARPEDSQPGCFRVAVTDHGPGIPPAEHERIFERFYRLGSELRRETAGVGIGLSIVKHVMDAHGGRVVVKSAVGQGSTFVLELPHAGNAGKAIT